MNKYNAKRKARAFVNRNEGLILACFFTNMMLIGIVIYIVRG